MEPQLPPLQAALVPPPQQMQHDQQRRQPLGDDAGQRHAVRRHVALDDEEQVQRHVQHPRQRQVDEGPLGVAGGAQHAVAEVIEGHGRHTEGVYF